MKQRILFPIVGLLIVLSTIFLSGCSQYKQPLTEQPAAEETTPLDQDIQSLDSQTIPDGTLDTTDSELNQVQTDLSN